MSVPSGFWWRRLVERCLMLALMEIFGVVLGWIGLDLGWIWFGLDFDDKVEG